MNFKLWVFFTRQEDKAILPRINSHSVISVLCYDIINKIRHQKAEKDRTDSSDCGKV